METNARGVQPPTEVRVRGRVRGRGGVRGLGRGRVGVRVRV